MENVSFCLRKVFRVSSFAGKQSKQWAKASSHPTFLWVEGLVFQWAWLRQRISCTSGINGTQFAYINVLDYYIVFVWCVCAWQRSSIHRFSSCRSSKASPKATKGAPPPFRRNAIRKRAASLTQQKLNNEEQL